MPRRSSTGATPYQSRSDQVADYLRGQIGKGVWGASLPSERELSAQLRVGRHTLRAALAMLESEGLLVERSQRGTLLNPGRKEKEKGGHTIGMIYAAARVMGPLRVYLDEIRHFFSERGVEVILHRVSYHDRQVPAHFRRLMTTHRHAAWIIVSPPKPIQDWVAEQNFPAVMLGSRMGESRLPNVYWDMYAATRHAVGMMLARGHRRLALVMPVHEKGEDVLSREAFLDAIRESPYAAEIAGRIAVHQQERESVFGLVDRLLAAKERCTAWLICRQGHYLTIHSHLLRLGVRIPEELSLISRDSEYYFEELSPIPTRYEVDPIRFARRVAVLTEKLMAGKLEPGEQLRLMPRFVAGETLGAIAPPKRP